MSSLPGGRLTPWREEDVNRAKGWLDHLVALYRDSYVDAAVENILAHEEQIRSTALSAERAAEPVVRSALMLPVNAEADARMEQLRASQSPEGQPRAASPEGEGNEG